MDKLPHRPLMISATSWISVGLLSGILWVAIRGTAAAVSADETLKQQGRTIELQSETITKQGDAIDNLNASVTDLGFAVDRLADATEVRVWIAEFGRLNPTLTVPPFSPFRDSRK